jgi:hypothetical protein
MAQASSSLGSEGRNQGSPLAGELQDQLQAQEALLAAQSRTVQRFLESQGRQVADGLLARVSQLRFTLPDQIVIDPEKQTTGQIPPDQRQQAVGGFVDRFTRADMRVLTRQHLAELEQSPDPAISTAARLTRHATVRTMVYLLLPTGRQVEYRAAEGEAIPSVPAGATRRVESAITAPTDVIVEEAQDEAERGEVIVPYVPYARLFFLPQWVAFDEHDQLLVGSAQEAEAHIASMQRFLDVLHAAVSLAPYMVADPEYQRKRYGILGQLVNQGRALARFQVQDIVETIKLRASAGSLNRGLSLSLPYFDDQSLQMKTRDFEVIPAGRIMFIPAFVVRAMRDEEAKVAQDTRLDPATRNHVLDELRMLADAFSAGDAGSPAPGSGSTE